MLGLQLWLNLPAHSKMTAPKYRDIRAADIPAITAEGVRTRVVASGRPGMPGGASGDFMPLSLLDIQMSPGAEYHWASSEGATVFAYVFEGEGRFGAGRRLIPARHALLTGPGTGFRFSAGDRGLRLVLFESEPLREPIAWGGPIVMNTAAELRLAFEELEQNTFIKQA